MYKTVEHVSVAINSYSDVDALISCQVNQNGMFRCYAEEWSTFIFSDSFYDWV